MKFRFRREYDWRNKETAFVVLTREGVWTADQAIKLLREELLSIMNGYRSNMNGYRIWKSR